MTNTPSRISLGGIFYLVLAFTLGGYFTFAAVQGDYGVFRRVQINAEAEALTAEPFADRVGGDVEPDASAVG